MDYVMLFGALLGCSTVLAITIIAVISVTRLNNKTFIKQ